ncbi:MAG: hypothetical protein WDM92_05780 [Caulobacteraceae bacterium]
MSNSSVSQNVNGAIAAVTTASGSHATISVDHSTVAQNGLGLNANGAGSTVRFGSSTVSGNTQAFKILSGGTLTTYGDNQVSGGTLTTYGDNQVSDNGSLGSTPTSSPPS